MKWEQQVLLLLLRRFFHRKTNADFLLWGMNEHFLHYIWRTLNFTFTSLKTEDGMSLDILNPGRLNHDQGPDFLDATMRIGYLRWSGQVELHLRSKDWYRHKHDEDLNYNNVILHVVLHSDGIPIRRADGTLIPELKLDGRIPLQVLKRFDTLNLSENKIPCEGLISKVPKFFKIHALELMGVDRIRRKANEMRQRLRGTIQDWEQVLWEEIAAAIAGKPNQNAFRALARTLPLKVIREYSRSRFRLEALLFGTGGLLSGSAPDPYFHSLKSEWEFLRNKHRLHQSHVRFRFLRMRPASFPTIRLSQLAHLLVQFPALSELLLPDFPLRLLETPVLASEYWKSHYRFGEKAASREKSLGEAQKQIMLINSLIPLGYLYHRFHGRADAGEKAVERTNSLPPEANRITREFAKTGLHAETALHSQGMLELRNHYCSEKKCLHCGIGQRILKSKEQKWLVTPSLSSEPVLKPGSL